MHYHKISTEYFKGMCIVIRVKLSPEQIESLAKVELSKRPLIVSSLFKHERKISVNHANVSLHNENVEDFINSKKEYEIHCGFRKFKSSVIFSRVYNNCDKQKFVKRIGDEYEGTFLASFYGQITFPPSNLIIYSLDAEKANGIKCLSLTGRMLLPDPFRV